MQQCIVCRKFSKRSPSLLIKTLKLKRGFRCNNLSIVGSYPKEVLVYWLKPDSGRCFDLSLLRYNNSCFSVTDSQKTVQHDLEVLVVRQKILVVRQIYLLNAVKFSPIDMKGSKKRGAHERALPKRRNLDEVDFSPQFRRGTNTKSVPITAGFSTYVAGSVPVAAGDMTTNLVFEQRVQIR